MPLADKLFGGKGLDKIKTYSGPGLMGAGAVGTFIFGKIMDAVSDKPHKIAELTIDDK
jgi:hypothetical protein